MRAITFICIALCITAAAAAEVQSTSTWFPDPMASSKASTMSGYRSRVEKERLCFRTSSFCFTGPPFGPGIAKTWIEDNMECAPCPEAHHDSYGPHHPDPDSDSIAAQLTPILSKCLLQATTTFPSILLPSHDGMGLSGTYKATCVLQEDSKAGCKFPPTCEDTLVTIQGVIYSVDHAVVAGPTSSVQPLYTPDCTPTAPSPPPNLPPPSPARRNAPPPPPGVEQKLSTPDAPAPAGKAKARSLLAANPQPTPQTVKVGGASLYKGTFTVQSTTHPLKFTRGHHQYSIFIGPPPMPKDVKLAEGLPKLGDAVHMFDFVADSQPSYYRID